jgi:hypothetical protein
MGLSGEKSRPGQYEYFTCRPHFNPTTINPATKYQLYQHISPATPTPVIVK